MKPHTICILDGRPAGSASGDGGLSTLRQTLAERGWSERVHRLADLEIAPCRGCFACWVKTPGICIIDDVGRDVARSVIRSDLAVFVTEITFGGYSSILKKAVDRLIPLILPFFHRVNGEVHHAPRYGSYPSLLGIGLLPASNGEQERIFRTTVARNAINMQSPKSAACILYEGDADEEATAKVLRALGEVV